MLHDCYAHALTFDEYLDAVEAHQELWRAITERVEIPETFIERIQVVPGSWHLLILSEDWCGDAVNTVPVIGRLAELAANLDCRILARDANLDIMDAHLTGTSRSIPIAILLDDAFEEHDWWGPRPRPLQHWVLGDGRALPRPERYRETRRWYARDRGLTTLEEIVAMVERRGELRGEAGSGEP